MTQIRAIFRAQIAGRVTYDLYVGRRHAGIVFGDSPRNSAAVTAAIAAAEIPPLVVAESIVLEEADRQYRNLSIVFINPPSNREEAKVQIARRLPTGDQLTHLKMVSPHLAEAQVKSLLPELELPPAETKPMGQQRANGNRPLKRDVK